MGTDLIAKVTDSFQRRQRRSLEQLEEPSLFTCAPRLSCGLIVTPCELHELVVGEDYRLSIVDARLVVVRDVTVVGYVDNPPDSVLDTMRTTSPSAHGRIKSVSTLTKQAEIVLE